MLLLGEILPILAILSHFGHFQPFLGLFLAELSLLRPIFSTFAITLQRFFLKIVKVRVYFAKKFMEIV